MKKLVSLFVILILSSSFVSAGFFDKITGKVTESSNIVAYMYDSSTGQCVKTTLDVCSASSVGCRKTMEDCQSVYGSSATPTTSGSCTPGEIKCDANALAKCSSSGIWMPFQICENGCQNGACLGEEETTQPQPEESSEQSSDLTNRGEEMPQPDISETEQCEGGILVCQDEALYCQKDGVIAVIEDCTYGCNEEEKRCIGEFDNPITGTCVEAIPGHNNLNENRINIVFIGFNYDDFETFKFFVESAIDFNSNYYGLLSVEPYKSNKNKFNFWYVDEVQYIESIGSGREGGGNATGELFRRTRTLPIVCNYSNQYPLGLVNADEYGFASFNGSAFAPMEYNYMDQTGFPSDCTSSDINGDGCVNDKDMEIIETRGLNIIGFSDCYAASYGCNPDMIPEDSRLFYYKSGLFAVVHEFSHSFGLLFDEYNMQGVGDFQGGLTARNCFVASSKEECLAHAPWKDLLGKGCGDASAIDCTPEDKDYSLEINCFEGCSYAISGIYRPTLLSIMGGQETEGLDVYNTAYSFRLVNERALCQRIADVTGSAGGYCSQFGISSSSTETNIQRPIQTRPDPNIVPENLQSTQCTSGCLYNGKCIPMSMRVDDQFCNIDGQLEDQKAEDSSCNNNFECSSNLCIDDKCISAGFFKKLMNWFSNRFG